MRVLSRWEHGILTDTFCTECELRLVASGARSPAGTFRIIGDILLISTPSKSKNTEATVSKSIPG